MQNMKSNFRKDEPSNSQNLDTTDSKKNLSPEEFEDFIKKSGAKGSFMIYRSEKKDDELGLDEL
jgi:hypothetical protein